MPGHELNSTSDFLRWSFNEKNPRDELISLVSRNFHPTYGFFLTYLRAIVVSFWCKVVNLFRPCVANTRELKRSNTRERICCPSIMPTQFFWNLWPCHHISWIMIISKGHCLHHGFSPFTALRFHRAKQLRRNWHHSDLLVYRNLCLKRLAFWRSHGCQLLFPATHSLKKTSKQSMYVIQCSKYMYTINSATTSRALTNEIDENILSPFGCLNP